MTRRDAGRHLPSVLAALGVTAGAALLPVATASPAAATDYRYWSYWQASAGSWQFASVGPGGSRPPDGSVEGWRFAVSGVGGGPAPRAVPDFDAVCGDTPRSEGTKRIAVVLDHGTPDDAPAGERPPPARTACARVDGDASGADVLAAVAETRFDAQGILCGIDGYPVTGCAEPVRAGEDGTERDEAAPPSDDDTGGGTLTGLAVGAAIVASLGGAALLRARRDRG